MLHLYCQNASTCFDSPHRLRSISLILFYSCSSEDGEKKDHDKSKDEGPPEASVEEKKAPKKRLNVRKEPPEAFMASFFAGLEIYQTKMLVRCFLQTTFNTSFIDSSRLELTVLHISHRTTWPEISTTSASWRFLLLLPSTSSSSSTRYVSGLCS